MQNLVRTTIRIRKDLFDLSRMIAVKKGTSLQEIINQTLALGFGYLSDFSSQKEAMFKIDRFRKSLARKKINLGKLLDESKKDLK